MNYSFRPSLTKDVNDYASHTAHPEGDVIDCTLGVNPYGFPPAAAEALQHYDYRQIARYPHEDALRPAIQRYWHGYSELHMEQISLCNGSYLGLFCLNNLFFGTDRKRVVSFVPTFTDMLTNASFFDMEIVPVPFVGRTEHAPTEALLRAIDRHTALVYLDRPNNPTGNVLPMQEVEAILRTARAAGAFVLVDEVFADFLPREESCVPLLERYDNLIIVRTFSKGFGLADLRAGYVLAPPQITKLMAKTVNPFILPSFVRMACAAALMHPDHPAAHQADFAMAKRALLEATGSTLIMEPTDLRTPILVMRSTTDRDLQSCYLEQGIMTVSGREFEALDEQFVRISIPVSADVDRLIRATAVLDHKL